jgi:hypothetical protein
MGIDPPANWSADEANEADETDNDQIDWLS